MAFAQPGYIGRRVELAPPPRPVTLGARAAVMFGGLRQISWGVLLFFSLFIYIFGVDSELLSLIEFRGKLDTTTGKVLSVQSTSASDNKRRVMQVDYSYMIGDRPMSGASYTVAGPPQPGSTVTIEYRPDRPSSSRIVGLRARTFSAGSGFILLPFFGVLVVAVVNVFRGAREAALLKQGALGFAKLVKKEPTTTRVNKQVVYRYDFELDLPPDAVDASYRASSRSVERKYRFSVKTHKGHAIEDEPFEPVIYDPDRAGRGLALDAMGPTISQEGGFESSSGLVYVLLPILCLASTTGIVAFIVAAF